MGFALKCSLPPEVLAGELAVFRAAAVGTLYGA